MSEQTANLCTTDACESLRARLAKYEDAEGNPIGRQPSGVACANDWFLSLPPERQAVLREDKWLLADAAFKAGKSLNSSHASAGEPVYQFQCREIGEGEWGPCDYSRYLYCQKSPEHDTKVVQVGVSAGVVDERAEFIREFKLDGKIYYDENTHQWLTTRDSVEGFEMAQRVLGCWVGWQARATLTASAPSHGEQVRVPEGWTVERGYSPSGYVLHSPSGSMIRVCDSGMGGIETAFAMFLKALLAASPSAGSQGGEV